MQRPRPVSRSRPALPSSETGLYLPCACRTLDLESRLQEVQDAAAARERELGQLVDQLRREKQEAEARAAGVDMAKMRVSRPFQWGTIWVGR